MPKYHLYANNQVFTYKTPYQISQLIGSRIKTMEQGQIFRIVESTMSPNTLHFTKHNDEIMKFSVLRQWYATPLESADLLAFTTDNQAHFYAMSPSTLTIVTAILSPVINMLGR